MKNGGTAIFKQVTIVGLGLIGGSLGMALRRRRLAAKVVGLSRYPATIRLAKRCGAIDEGTTDARQAVRDADLVVLASPVDLIAPQGKRLAQLMRPGSVLTDVGSTKGSIVRALGRLPKGIAFVGAHPLAGSERRGITAARADLFDGSVCLITKVPGTGGQALARVQALWRPLVRRVITVSPIDHDRLLAHVSHLPHLVAFSLMQAAPRRALSIAPRSFLDATRVAQSDPDLWDDILRDNRLAVLASLRAFERECRRMGRLLQPANASALKQWLRHAQRLRASLER